MAEKEIKKGVDSVTDFKSVLSHNDYYWETIKEFIFEIYFRRIYLRAFQHTFEYQQNKGLNLTFIYFCIKTAIKNIELIVYVQFCDIFFKVQKTEKFVNNWN